ncbi:subtilisin inhibitor CLSI-II [Cajanus cajan]|uniref:Subtilisin inhibitor CLSI-II n=1 Tax=Cajanus cajan TaxID=3821 RepID=A0A151SIQ8_CAJCA|nr:subtilisin inhibitor CLSI-II [Cajanus cajan]KYP54716.1 Subtilisin inhibitor CLSI-II [Cajanus cajan]
MKAALVVFGFLSIIFSLGLSAPRFRVDQVRDSLGNAVFPGMSYYIVPYDQPGGGIKLDNLGQAYECPVTFLQDYTRKFRGVALQFKVHGITIGPGLIFTGSGSPLLVKVTQGQKPFCASSDEVVMYLSKKINKICLGIGGPEDHYYSPTFNGRFHFEQPDIPYAYYLVFCHSDAPENCTALGRFDNHEGGSRLVFADNDTKPIKFLLVNTLDKPPPTNVKN